MSTLMVLKKSCLADADSNDRPQAPSWATDKNLGSLASSVAHMFMSHSTNSLCNVANKISTVSKLSQTAHRPALFASSGGAWRENTLLLEPEGFLLRKGTRSNASTPRIDQRWNPLSLSDTRLGAPAFTRHGSIWNWEAISSSKEPGKEERWHRSLVSMPQEWMARCLEAV